jgi:uncharacterized protein (DUF934 family)
MHVIVENQFAIGQEPVPVTIERPIREGLDRREALHAVGAVLTDDIQALLSAGEATFDKQSYRNRLNKLTAKQ